MILGGAFPGSIRSGTLMRWLAQPSVAIVQNLKRLAGPTKRLLTFLADSITSVPDPSMSVKKLPSNSTL
ncbi:hypothetical protein OMR07_06565 [Methylobacterium organophilum]|nr:hypothetical protein [Methylobacterium organophilum]